MRRIRERKRGKLVPRRERDYRMRTVRTERSHTDAICRLLGIHRWNWVSILPTLARHKVEIRDYLFSEPE